MITSIESAAPGDAGGVGVDRRELRPLGGVVVDELADLMSPVIGRTEIESPLVAHPALQPVMPCWSKPSRGERITPRISIMSVPSRTGIAVPLAW